MVEKLLHEVKVTASGFWSKVITLKTCYAFAMLGYFNGGFWVCCTFGKHSIAFQKQRLLLSVCNKTLLCFTVAIA